MRCLNRSQFPKSVLSVENMCIHFSKNLVISSFCLSPNADFVKSMPDGRVLMSFYQSSHFVDSSEPFHYHWIFNLLPECSLYYPSMQSQDFLTLELPEFTQRCSGFSLNFSGRNIKYFDWHSLVLSFWIQLDNPGTNAYPA